VDSFT